MNEETDRITAESIAVNALGFNTRAELDPGEKLHLGMVTAAIQRSIFDARRDEAEHLHAAWKVMQEKHTTGCVAPGLGRCSCGLHARQAEARKVLDGE